LAPSRPLFRFKTEARWVALAMTQSSVLAAYFYGRDIARVWRVAEALEYGIVAFNTGINSTEVAPFGGVKNPDSAVKAQSTVSMITSRLSISASAAYVLVRRLHFDDTSIAVDVFFFIEARDQALNLSLGPSGALACASFISLSAVSSRPLPTRSRDFPVRIPFVGRF